MLWLWSTIENISHKLSGLNKDYIVILFVYCWLFSRSLLLSVVVKSQLVDPFDRFFIRIDKVDLDNNFKFSPSSLVSLKWKFLNSHSRFRERWMECEHDLFDKVRYVFIVCASDVCAPLMRIVFISLLCLLKSYGTKDYRH